MDVEPCFQFSKVSAPRSAWPDSGTGRLVHKDLYGKREKWEVWAGMTFNPDADRRSAVRLGKRSRSEPLLGTEVHISLLWALSMLGHVRLWLDRLNSGRQDAIGPLFPALCALLLKVPKSQRTEEGAIGRDNTRPNRQKILNIHKVKSLLLQAACGRKEFLQPQTPNTPWVE